MLVSSQHRSPGQVVEHQEAGENSFANQSTQSVHLQMRVEASALPSASVAVEHSAQSIRPEPSLVWSVAVEGDESSMAAQQQQQQLFDDKSGRTLLRQSSVLRQSKRVR